MYCNCQSRMPKELLRQNSINFDNEIIIWFWLCAFHITIHFVHVFSVVYLEIINFLLIPQCFIYSVSIFQLIDLLYYLVILMILIVAAGTVYHANIYPNYDVKPLPDGIQNWRIWTVLRIPYWQVYGELFLDTLEGTHKMIYKNK